MLHLRINLFIKIYFNLIYNFFSRLLGGKTLRDVINRMKVVFQNNDIKLLRDATQQARNVSDKLFKLLQAYFKVIMLATYCGESHKFKFKLKCPSDNKYDDSLESIWGYRRLNLSWFSLFLSSVLRTQLIWVSNKYFLLFWFFCSSCFVYWFYFDCFSCYESIWSIAKIR